MLLCIVRKFVGSFDFCLAFHAIYVLWPIMRHHTLCREAHVFLVRNPRYTLTRRVGGRFWRKPGIVPWIVHSIDQSTLFQSSLYRLTGLTNR